MRFRNQLAIGHIALVIIIAVTGVTGAIALHRTTSRLEEVARVFVEEISSVELLRFQSEHLVATSRGYLLSGDPASFERFAEVEARLEANLAQLGRRPQLAADVERIDALARAYVRAAAGLARRRQETGDPQSILPQFERTLMPARAAFEEAIERLVEREQVEFRHATQDARELAHATEVILLVATSSAIVLGMVMAGVSIRRLNRQYVHERSAVEAARKAAAARDEILAIVSHDLRNPLTAVSMGAAVIDEIGEPRTRRHAASIANAANRMRHLLDELIDVARLESGTFAPRLEVCRVRELFDATLSLFEARAVDAHVALTAQTDGDVAVMADREAMLQVLANLVGNAIKFTPEGGKVTLAMRARDGLVELEVADTGRGIPEEQLPHVFERFWQGRNRERGSLGLGLYICKQLVEAHRGQIRVTSRIAEGSTFTVELPRAA